MFTAFKQLFIVITTMFTAAEKVAKSLDNLASVGDVMSTDYLEVAKIEAAIKLSEKKAELRRRLAEDESDAPVLDAPVL